MRWGWIVSLSLVAGCQAGEPPIQTERHSIIGGTPAPGDPAVVQYGGCTGTLIAPRVVLTAAHCVSGRVESGQTSGGDVRFGSGFGDWFASAPIVDIVMHRRYDPPAFQQYDIALLRLGADAPEDVAPIPVNFEPLTEEHIGLPVRTVGFGNTDGGEGTGFGTKRKVELTIDELTPFHVGLGTYTRNTCQGDSGGPTFAVLGGEERVVSVTSFGSDECRGRSYTTRTDVFAEDFLIPILDAWSGPCSHDGTCVEDDCRTPDPDCDLCGFDRFCSRECETPDLDCALGGLDGDFCQDRYDCESRLCIEAPDEPRLSYCSRPCAPEGDECATPTGACRAVGGESVCTYPGTTPSSQGAHCEESGDCRSGICDLRDRICIEPCGEGQPACAEDYACQPIGDGQSACRIPTGGCRAGGGAGGGVALLLLLCYAFQLRHRDQTSVS